jgi:serine protease AprX
MKQRCRIHPNMLIVFSMLLVFMAGSPSLAGVISPDLQTALDSQGEDQVISILVSLADKADLSAFKDKNKGVRRARIIKALQSKADTSQKNFKSLLQKRGAKNPRFFWIINGFGITADPELIRELAGMDNVDSIRLDKVVKVPDSTPAAAPLPEWNLDMVQAPALWEAGFIGSNSVVANMDTGVDVNHPDLALNWRGGPNSWYDPNGQHATPYDANGHGTQTMSIMVGGDAGGSAIGMAPGAQWIAVKIFNDDDQGSLSAIHLGFQWLLDPDNNPATDDAPDVVNNSWVLENQTDVCNPEFDDDIQALKAGGTAVIFSAGNYGPTFYTSVSPANAPGTLAVGAVDDTLAIASSSSRGPSACDDSIYPQLVAPGVAIRAADLTFGGFFPDSYANVDGTSFAAPHVAGAMALLLDAVPEATVSDLESVLENSALDLGALGPDNDFGYGLVDCVEAYNLLINMAPCTDGDGDGYYDEANCGTSLDCNDADPGINPGACDIKRDGIDQDCNGRDRRKGKTCPGSGDPGGDPGDTGGTEGKGKTCSDGQDNDGDGVIDCADFDCSRNKACK